MQDALRSKVACTLVPFIDGGVDATQIEQVVNIVERISRHDPHSVTIIGNAKMRQGYEVAIKGKWPVGFKFLPIEYSDKLDHLS